MCPTQLDVNISPGQSTKMGYAAKAFSEKPLVRAEHVSRSTCGRPRNPWSDGQGTPLEGIRSTEPLVRSPIPDPCSTFCSTFAQKSATRETPGQEVKVGCVLSSSNLKVIQAPSLVRGQIQPDVPLVALFFRFYTRVQARTRTRAHVSLLRKKRYNCYISPSS